MDKNYLGHDFGATCFGSNHYTCKICGSMLFYNSIDYRYERSCFDMDIQSYPYDIFSITCNEQIIKNIIE